MSNISGLSAYQQTNQIWNQNNKKSAEVDAKTEAPKTESEVKKFTFKPIDTKSALVPTKRDDIGMAIGDVKLSDTAKKYYDQLKSKFGNMEFIAVSKDMMAQVKANAAAYGNVGKTVVLIDEEKLERMATDESYRKKYEGIITMAQSQIEGIKNSLSSSGAKVTNFGISVNEDGTTSFFATLEKSSKDQAKRIEKKQVEKREARAKEKKLEAKKAQEERIKNRKNENSVEDEAKVEDKKEYIRFEASSADELLDYIQKYSYANNSVLTEAEKALGQNIDFEG